MKWPDLLRSALFGLNQHKLRTLLTLCGVTLGALLLFTSISGGLGVVRTVNERLGIGDRLLEVRISSGFLLEEVSAAEAREAGFDQEMSDERRVRLATASGVGGRKNVPLRLKDLEALNEIPHVAGVWPRISFAAAMHFDQNDQWNSASVKAFPPSKIPQDFLVAGETFSGEDADEVIVGELFLYLMGIRSDAQLSEVIGSQVRFVPGSPEIVQRAQKLVALLLSEGKVANLAEQEAALREEIESELSKAKFKSQDFTVVGVIRSLDKEEMRYHPDLAGLSRHVTMPHSKASEIWQVISKPDRTVQATVRADRPENVMRMEEYLSDRGYRTASMAKLALQIRTAVLLISLIIIAIAAAALVISGIGITNTMVMNVLQRRREIAIRKSIGAQDTDIQRIFLLEGMLIGVTGGILGLALGRFLSGLTSEYIQQLLEWKLKIPFGSDIFAFPWWLLLLTPLLSAAVTTVASVLPARQAARVDPVATLRAL